MSESSQDPQADNRNDEVCDIDGKDAWGSNWSDEENEWDSDSSDDDDDEEYPNEEEKAIVKYQDDDDEVDELSESAYYLNLYGDLRWRK